MKKFLALLVSVIVASGMLCQSGLASPNNAVPETNLGNLTVAGYPDNMITYGNGTAKPYPANGIFLYINGSMYVSDVIIENDRTLVPLRFISETLGAKVGWDDAARRVTITDGNNKIELVIGNNKPTLNGKAVQIDVAPKIYNDYTYVPLRFIAESLSCKVDWFDGSPGYNGAGEALQQPHYPIGNKQVMISRYPASAITISRSEAVSSLKQQLMTAYEGRFGVKFSPLDTMPNSDDEKETYRYSISHLSSILYENDRFYAIHFVWVFLVDKYTGTVLLHYQGMPQEIWKFDPNQPGAIVFAG